VNDDGGYASEAFGLGLAVHNFLLLLGGIIYNRLFIPFCHWEKPVKTSVNDPFGGELVGHLRNQNNYIYV